MHYPCHQCHCPSLPVQRRAARVAVTRGLGIAASLAIAACRACNGLNFLSFPHTSLVWSWVDRSVIGNSSAHRVNHWHIKIIKVQRNHHDILKANNHSVFAKKGTRNPFALMDSSDVPHCATQSLPPNHQLPKLRRGWSG